MPGGRQLPLLDAGAADRLLAACVRRWPPAADGAGGGGPLALEDLAGPARAAAERLARRLRLALHKEQLLPRAEVLVEEDTGTGGAALLVRGGALAEARRLESLADLAEFCCGLCPGAEDNSAVIEEEFQSSHQNECLGLLFQRKIWAVGRGASLWSQVQRLSTESTSPGGGVSDELEQRLIFWEQFAAFGGHPLHVMAKSKKPLSLDGAISYSPEFGEVVCLDVLAVESTLLRVFPSPEAWREMWTSQCPVALQRLKEALEQAGHAIPSTDFSLLPLHPLNKQKVQDLYGRDFEAGRMLILPEVLRGRPTLSFRTLIPTDGSFGGLRWKLPVPVFATSLPRYISPVEVFGSILLCHALRQLELPRELGVQFEDFAAHLRFGDDSAYSYEEARYCASIIRESPTRVACHGCWHVPLSAMFGRADEAGPRLWADFWTSLGIRDGLAWFGQYVAVVLRAQLSVFLRYGIALEAHQQNSLLELHEAGALRRLIYQELGGGIFWDPERLADFPEADFRRWVYARDDVLEPLEKCAAVVRHTMLRMHLFPLADEVASFFGLKGQELRALVVEEVRRAPDQAWAAPAPGDARAAAGQALYARQATELLLAGSGPVKALLRMRLLQTKGEIYVEEEEEEGEEEQLP